MMPELLVADQGAKKHRGQSWNAGYVDLVALAVFAVILILTIEVYHAYQVYHYGQQHLERIGNMAISLSLSRKSRDGDFEIDQEMATQQFYRILAEELDLQGDGRFGDDYLLVIETFELQPSPPLLRISGYLEVKPLLLRNALLADLHLRLPVRVRTILQDLWY